MVTAIWVTVSTSVDPATSMESANQKQEEADEGELNDNGDSTVGNKNDDTATEQAKEEFYDNGPTTTEEAPEGSGESPQNKNQIHFDDYQGDEYEGEEYDGDEYEGDEYEEDEYEGDEYLELSTSGKVLLNKYVEVLPYCSSKFAHIFSCRT